MNTEKLSNKKGKRFKKDKNVSNKIKILIVFLLILMFVIVGVFLMFLDKSNVNDLDQKEKYEEKQEVDSIKILEEKIFEEMKIKDITLEVDKYASYFKCNIENITDKIFEQKDIFIVFVKEDNSELARFKYHLEEISLNEKQKISIITTTNLESAYNFYIENQI